MKFYSDWALRIAGGQWTDGHAFYGLPGYAYCLALLFKLSGGFDPFFAGLIQAGLDAGIAVLLWKIAQEVFAAEETEPAAPGFRSSEIVGLAAATAWAFFVPAEAFSTVLMPTVYLVFAYYFCLWVAVKSRQTVWWKPWPLMGLLVGFIAMLVATILFAVPFLIAAILRSVNRGTSARQRVQGIGLAVISLVAGVYIGASPAWIHNYFIAHEPVMLSAHSGINFWIGNNPEATGYPKMPPGIRASQEGLLHDSITLAEATVGKKLTRAEVSRFWSAQANQYIRENFVAWMRLIAVKFGNFWNAYQYDDLSIIKLLQDEGILLPGIKFGCVSALGLAGLIPVLRRFPRAGWVVAAVGLHLCALMPVFVTERYRLAAVPGLILIGAGGLWVFWENTTLARWKPIALYLGLCAGAAWFASIPRANTGLWALDHYKAGIRATTAGDFNRAQHNLETAYAYIPDSVDIDFALGNLWLEKSDRSTDPAEKGAWRGRAKTFYRLVLDANPRHAGTLYNLGVVAWEEKRFDVAEKFLTASIAAEPASAKTHYLLSQVRLELGNRAGALESIDEAIRLRPTIPAFTTFREKVLQHP